ncbi:uncharacterized protein VP01_348g7 [Puccinia sorghi]|uniref:Helicase C-terminal domain-containing protein n=1 Tax=Puccinia sorghi TaxID=27349 RepID=A0A0L6UXR5_9BASI|nr:uncharacterized protein VP01_348g7 [Puccinia sorghi]
MYKTPPPIEYFPLFTLDIQRKSAKAIELLQQLLSTVSIRRLKTEVLNLPPKVEEEQVGFFRQLTMLRLYCDHPNLVDESKWELQKTKTTWRESPKIVHLITDLKKNLKSSQGSKIPKAVVFSQWTTFLEMGRFPVFSVGQRERSLEKFRQDPNVQLLLETIGAGGVGIDLTSAQKVYLMVSQPDDVWENCLRTHRESKKLQDPCWNPSVESQATDRAYRLGQTCLNSHNSLLCGR